METAKARVATLNTAMLDRLRRCAADTSPNWEGSITIYPPEARELVDLVDAVGGAPQPSVDDRRPVDSYIRPVLGGPDATAAEPCDEHCDDDCMHHTPNVGWDLSFGSRINFGPISTADARIAVDLHLSDDAVAKGRVRRTATEQQVLDYAQMLIGMVGGSWKLVPQGETGAGMPTPDRVGEHRVCQ